MKRTAPQVPIPLGLALGESVAHACVKRGFNETRLISEWPAIVGQTIAKVSYPQKITGQRTGGAITLHIVTEGPYALELQHLEPQLLEKMAVYFGYRYITRIQLHQHRIRTIDFGEQLVNDG